MGEILGKFVTWLVFSIAYVVGLFMVLTLAGNLLVYAVPFVRELLATKAVPPVPTIAWDFPRMVLEMPNSYKWLYYTIGLYFIIQGVIRPFFNWLSYVRRVATAPPKEQNRSQYSETEGERRDRERREYAARMEATQREQERFQQQMQGYVQQPQPMVYMNPTTPAPQQQPVEAKIQVIPIPVQMSGEQLEKFQETQRRMEQVKEKSSETQGNTKVEPKSEPKSAPKAEQLKPATSKMPKVDINSPNEKPKAFKRNRNLPVDENALEGAELRAHTGKPKQLDGN